MAKFDSCKTDFQPTEKALRTIVIKKDTISSTYGAIERNVFSLFCVVGGIL